MVAAPGIPASPVQHRAGATRGAVVRSRIGLLLAAVLALVGTGCTADPGPESAAPGEPAAPAVVERLWTSTGIDPVSEVRSVGGVAVVYGAVADGLMIYGLDPGTGEQLWSHPAALPTLGSSDYAVVRELDESVAYFRPTGTDRVAQLVLADPRSGADEVVSAARYWASYPTDCDDPTWLCAYSWVQSPAGSWAWQRFQVDRLTGATAPNDSVTTIPDGGTELPVGNLYYSFPTDGQMSLGRVVDGLSSWLRPASEIFGADLPKPSYFRTFDPTEDGFVIISTSGPGSIDPGTSGDRRERLDLSRDLATTGLDLSDGSARWTAPGSELGCAGQPAVGFDDDADDAFLCRYTGTATRDPSGLRGSDLLTADLQVTLQHIDPATGAAQWSTELGDAKAMAADTSGQETALLDDTHLLVPNSAGGLIVDLETGQTRPPASTDTVWCQVTGSFARPEPYFAASSPVLTANRWGVVRPCDATGKDAAIPTTGIPSSIGASFDDDPRLADARFGDLRVIAVPDGISGFLVPADPSAEPATESEPDPDSATASSSATPTTPRSPSEPVRAVVDQAWAATGFEAKTTPVMLGGTAVLYGTVGTNLFLIGLDPASGEERWRKLATATAFAPDRNVDVVQIDNQVAYLRPTSDGRQSQIVLVDPATGAEPVVSQQFWWLEFPRVCGDNPSYLCAGAYDLSDLRAGDGILQVRTLRIDRLTGAVTTAPEDIAGTDVGSVTAPAGTTTLWNHLVSVNDAPVETVGYAENGVLLWSRPIADLLGPGATLDHGWYSSEDDGNIPVLQLSGVVGWSGESGSYPPLDLAANLVTVGIDSRDGTVLWTEPGTSPGCRYRLPGGRAMSTPGSDDPELRCRYTGRLGSSPEGKPYTLITPTDLTVALERVDLQTGKAVWSVPLGEEKELAVDAHGVTVTFLDDHRLLAGGQVIDVDDGSTRAPGADESFWCPGSQTFQQTQPWTSVDGITTFDKRVEGEVFVCDAEGNPIADTPTAVPLAVSAVTEQGLRLVATPNGVVAYRVPL